MVRVRGLGAVAKRNDARSEQDLLFHRDRRHRLVVVPVSGILDRMLESLLERRVGDLEALQKALLRTPHSRRPTQESPPGKVLFLTFEGGRKLAACCHVL